MDELFEKKHLTKKSEDFSKWYTEVIQKSGLADYAPVKGCQIIRPYGFSLWENIVTALDKMIKGLGAKNAYFPLFIPESFLKKEKEHVEGFSPELAVVTIAGGEELSEKLIVRPTSETIMYDVFSRWIDSWRDLPLLINQWANVVRWEKRTRLFLRTSEFLWQEGHTCHATQEQAQEMVQKALQMYISLYRDYFAMEGIWGQKSESEKFAGAVATFTLELLMPSGFALQGATSHNLGQNFAKVFEIKFKGKDKKEHFVWQTSWGLSTRSIGALVMAHGDNQGLILPPKIAPLQVVIIPVFQGEDSDKEVLNYSQKVFSILHNNQIRVYLDDDREPSVGWKYNEWELKGVPLRIEIGKKEVSQKTITAVRRDTGEKTSLSFDDGVVTEVGNLLDKIQNQLLESSRRYLKEHTFQTKSFSEFKELISQKAGFVKAFWCGNPECEKKIKEETKATVRCLPYDEPSQEGKCIYCGRRATHQWVFSRAY